MAQLEGILYGDAGGYPHLLKLGEMPGLSDGHHQPLVVPAAGEEVEEADPKIPDIPPVLAPARPGLYHALVGAEPGVPTINNVLGLGALVQLLQHRQHWRLGFLQYI